jgi:hypothetical protein
MKILLSQPKGHALQKMRVPFFGAYSEEKISSRASNQLGYRIHPVRNYAFADHRCIFDQLLLSDISNGVKDAE